MCHSFCIHHFGVIFKQRFLVVTYFYKNIPSRMQYRVPDTPLSIYKKSVMFIYRNNAFRCKILKNIKVVWMQLSFMSTPLFGRGRTFTRYSLLFTLLLVIFCSLLVTIYWLLYNCYSVLATSYSLILNRCSFPFTRYSLILTCCFLHCVCT